MIVALERWQFYTRVDPPQFATLQTYDIALTKRLVVIGTIAANAPYLGLLGTVLGIMLTFHTMGTAGTVAVNTIATVTKDQPFDGFGNPGNQGKRLPGVPRHGGSIWTTYAVQDGWFRHITIGGGMVARSERQGDFPNSYQLPGYATMDFMTAYKWQVGRTWFTFQFNATNVLDKEYFASSAFFDETTTAWVVPCADPATGALTFVLLSSDIRAIRSAIGSMPCLWPMCLDSRTASSSV